MSASRRRATALLASLVLLAATFPALAGAAVGPRVSFTQVQTDLMCVLCHEPLNVARSPEAYSENTYLRGLIRKGETTRQIERDMVAQYGPTVLAKPPARGFNVLVYVVPPLVVVIGLAVIVITIPRWRRRARAAAAAAAAEPRPAGPALSDEDAQRLDADLARRL